MSYHILITKYDIELIIKGLYNTDKSLFSSEQQQEIIDLADTLQFTLDEGDPEDLHDVSPY